MTFPFFAENLEDFGLKGAVKTIEISRATFFFEKGEWGTSSFFPYSNRLDNVANSLFDSNGICLKKDFLLPTGETRYIAVSTEKNPKEWVQVCFDYLSYEGERIIEKLDDKGRLIERVRYGAEDQLLETRYFHYKQFLVLEEAYGMTNQLYEKVFYTYDDKQRCIKEEVVGYPYNLVLGKIESVYNEFDQLREKRIYQLNSSLVQNIFYSYDNTNQCILELIYSYSGEEETLDVFRYKWKVDSYGNWIEKIKISIVSLRNRWIEKPLSIERRMISYY